MGAIEVVVVIVILSAGGAMLWGFWRSFELTKRLHPFTPAQRRAMRRSFAVAVTMLGVAFGLVGAIGSGGTGRVVGLAVIAAIVLLHALLTPWLYYRRARRRGAPADHDVPGGTS